MTYGELKPLECKRCGADVPTFEFGRGEYHYPGNGSEWGPYCSTECLDAVRREREGGGAVR